MEHSKALHQLGEAADLIAMIETLTAPNIADPARNAAAWAGLRVTLRNVREIILESHETLSADMVAKARARMDSHIHEGSDNSARQASPVKQVMPAASASPNVPAASSGNGNGANGARMERKDLRAQLEKFIDR